MEKGVNRQAVYVREIKEIWREELQKRDQTDPEREGHQTDQEWGDDKYLQ